VIDEPTRRPDEGALRGFGRDLIPRVLAGLVRRDEDFNAAEEAHVPSYDPIEPSNSSLVSSDQWAARSHQPIGNRGTL